MVVPHVQNKDKRPSPLKNIEATHTINVTDFGAIPNDGKNDWLAVDKALKELNQQSLVLKEPITLCFPTGTYDITAPDKNSFLNIEGISNFEINGNGSEIIIGSPIHGFLKLDNCSNGIIRGFHVDYSTLPFTQGVIKNINKKDCTFCFIPDEGYPDPDMEHFLIAKQRWGSLFEQDGKNLKHAANNLIAVTDIKRISNKEFKIVTKKHNLDDLCEGDRFVIIARRNGNPTYSIRNSFQISLIDNINYAGPAGGFASGNSMINVINCSILRKPGRLISQNADCIHVVPSIYGPWIENCTFEGQQDDAINIKTELIYIDKQIDEKSFIVSGKVNKGDNLKLFDPIKGTLEGTYTVKDMEVKSNKAHIKLNKKVKVTTRCGHSKDKHMFFNDDISNHGFVIKNNIFRDSRRYGMLIQATNGKILDNHITSTSNAAIVLQNSASWPEGFVPHDIEIRNNHIEFCGFDRKYLSEDGEGTPVVMKVNKYEKNDKEDDSTWQGLENIIFEGNKIIVREGAAINIHGLKNSCICNNEFIKERRSEDKAINITNSSQYIIKNNEITYLTEEPETYPKYFSFRGENNIKANSDYNLWEAYNEGRSGIIRKFITEEVPIDDKTPGFASTYSKRNPDKLLMLHLNGEARQVNGFPDVNESYFPGHWVYGPGTIVTSDCSSSDTCLDVNDATILDLPGYWVRRSSPKRFFPQMVIIVRLDDNGERLWYESEFARIKSVDTSKNKVYLERGVYGSKTLDYKGAKTYIAPIPGGHWGTDVMFYYNMSSTCPRDKNGLQATDVYVKEISSWFKDGGKLNDFDGIAFDVNYFDVSSRGKDWDTDNDGIADGGWINGINVWREGDINFFSMLREELGDDILITADGQHWCNQQIPNILNGIESEGLVQHNDMWRGFSRAINTHSYWINNSKRPNALRYVVMKLMGKDSDNPLQMRRFGAATAMCLEAAITEPVGEGVEGKDFSFLSEEYRQEGSLGHARSEIIRHFRSTDKVWESDFAANGLTVNLDVKERNDGEVAYIEFDLNDVAIPAGDVIFTVEASMNENISISGKENDVPAILWLEPESLPTYDDSKQYDQYFKDIYGLFNKRDEMTFYFRKMKEGKQKIHLKIYGAKSVTIHNVCLYAAQDVIIRDFDNATIVVNPSLESADINLDQYFPNYGIGSVSIPPVDAVFINHKNKN